MFRYLVRMLVRVGRPKHRQDILQKLPVVMGSKAHHVFKDENLRRGFRNELEAVTNKLPTWVISAPPMSSLREGLARGTRHINIQVGKFMRRPLLHGSEESLHVIVRPEENTRGVSRVCGKAMLEIDAKIPERISRNIHSRTIGPQRKRRSTVTDLAGEAVLVSMLLPLRGSTAQSGRRR